VGETGVLRWEYEQNRLEHYIASAGQWRVEEGDPSYQRNQMYTDELEHVIDAVRGTSAQSIAEGEQGAAVLAIALAALRSSAEGRTIDFQDPRDADATTRAWLSSLNPAS
jgi:predicted dehydrogenase